MDLHIIDRWVRITDDLQISHIGNMYVYRRCLRQALRHMRRFKKDLCVYFERGHCDKGQNCTFAHGHEELRGRFAQVRAGYQPTLGLFRIARVLRRLKRPRKVKQDENWWGNGRHEACREKAGNGAT